MNPIEEWLSQPGGLAARLRDVRTQAGLAGKELAEAAGWQPSKVSRLENGRQMPSQQDIDTWALVCQANAATIQNLTDMLKAIENARRDWRRRMRRGQVAVQASYNKLVQESSLVRHFETVYVPGLLQTTDYARRVLTEMVGLHGLDIDDVDATVATRMQRQQLLYNVGKQFEFLLAEPVLRWLLCPAEVMHGQLDRLQTVVGLPNVRFGILPMGVRLETTPQNSFQMYDDLAIVETFVGETMHHEEEAAMYGRALNLLWAEAVVGEDARHLIIAASGALPT
jgi:transcriptional regulator with XRE-family HTH domain